VNERKTILANKEISTRTMREKIDVLEKIQRDLRLKLEDRIANNEKMEKKYQLMLEEKVRLRNLIVKIKMRKITNPNQKLCKNCGKDYLETENFNWSCRIHRVFIDC